MTLDSCVSLQFDAPFLKTSLLGSQNAWGCIDFLDDFDVVLQCGEELIMSIITNVRKMEACTILLYQLSTLRSPTIEIYMNLA